VLHVRHTVVHRKAYAVEERAHVAIAVDEWSRGIRCGQIGVSGRPATEHPVMGRAIQRGVRRDRVAAPGASRGATPFNAISPPVSDSPQRAPNREGFEDPLSGASEADRRGFRGSADYGRSATRSKSAHSGHPVQRLGRSLPTHVGWCPRPDLSEMSFGVGFGFKYQMFAAPALVESGIFTSLKMSASERLVE
jgi:hypothetical protein